MHNPKELKNKVVDTTCLRIGSNFEGIASLDGYTLFINDALPGEDLQVRIEKCEKNYGYAKVLKRKNNSEYRVEPACKHYAQCGGCSCEHIEYNFALEQKSKMVTDCFKKYAKLDIQVPLTKGLDNPWNARNKTSLPIRDHYGEIQIGFYKKRSHNIVNVEQCPIAHPQVLNAIKALRVWMEENNVRAYNEFTGKGALRHIVVRNNKKDELMIVLVSTQKSLPNIEALITKFQKEVKGFVSLYLNINTKRDNVIMGYQNHLLYGQEVLQQDLLGLQFEISPLSFMQVNSQLTDVLYQTAIDMANINKNDICVDAYAGAGTISLIMARQCKEVVGIEIIKDAVKNAERNAENNHITNASFICGTVEETLPKLVEEKKITILLLDPPRKGVEQGVIDAIAAAMPAKIVYISCNPATQARDVNLMVQLGYSVQASQPIDMFSMTAEVENVMLLTK
ncbi:MAG: 23S rRNA (uracil(1939)-C(5))-methyltransferase RlmD [Eubacteriales bacterium]|nr:23S rRNA (uracil(1939)-C(5))-methyltransferase RlmD [Eubacteriales bacterium]